MSALTPWALGAFELILHAEMHYRNGEDFDRRIAIVGYDNAIEVAIHTYLKLHPLQRQNRTYAKNEIERWCVSYHSKVDFFFSELSRRSLPLLCGKAEFLWYHEVRNGQYHVGGATIPQGRELLGIRAAALWVFGVLFDVVDSENLIEQHLNERSGADLPSRTPDDDRLIDQEFGIVALAGRKYYSSELVHAIDPVLYSELAGDIRGRDATERELNGEVNE